MNDKFMLFSLVTSKPNIANYILTCPRRHSSYSGAVVQDLKN